MIVFVPLGEPLKTRTLYIPSDKVPLVVSRVWVVPDRVMVPTPLVIRSRMSKFVLVVSPHVPDCSPVAIFSMPPLAVYVLGMINPYAATSSQLVPGLGSMSV